MRENIINNIRYRLRSIPLYVRARSFMNYGLYRQYEKWKYESKILKSNPIITQSLSEDFSSSNPCSVRMLLTDADFMMGLWTLKSFYCHSEVDWPLIIHEGSKLADRTRNLIKFHFPNVKMIDYESSSILVNDYLRANNLLSLLFYRDKVIFFRRFVDYGLYYPSKIELWLDTDVLFFSTPTDIINNVINRTRYPIVNKDCICSYSLPVQDLSNYFSLDVKEFVNAGLALIPREIIDLKFIDQICSKNLIPPDFYSEQTCLALLFCQKSGQFFSQKYVMDTIPIDLKLKNIVSRHYAGKTISRYLYFREGIPFLLKSDRFAKLFK